MINIHVLKELKMTEGKSEMEKKNKNKNKKNPVLEYGSHGSAFLIFFSFRILSMSMVEAIRFQET